MYGEGKTNTGIIRGKQAYHEQIQRITTQTPGNSEKEMHIGQEVEIIYLLTPVGQNFDGVAMGKNSNAPNQGPRFLTRMAKSKLQWPRAS